MILGAILAMTLQLFGTGEDPGDPAYPPIPCSSPCVIEFSPGGVIDLFKAEGEQLASDGTKVIVDGPCLSACTILVDEDQANVCVTHNVVLGYHQSMRMSAEGPVYENISYKTPGLNKYINSHGGLPKPDSGHLLMLDYTQAQQFYKAC